MKIILKGSLLFFLLYVWCVSVYECVVKSDGIKTIWIATLLFALKLCEESFWE